MTRSIVDAHAHVWNRSRTPIDWIDESLPEIDRDFSVAELEEAGRTAAAAHGVQLDGFVLVQALNDDGETHDLLATAHGPVVGWLDLARPDGRGGGQSAVRPGGEAADDDADVADRVAALRAVPGGHRLVGIRHLAHVDPDPEWMLRPDVSRGLDALAAAGLVFDLVVRPWQLQTAARALDAHPALRFVLDHLGQPPADDTPDAAAFEAWERDIRALAERPNVVAKISGVAVRGDSAGRERLGRVGGVALDAFGPSRLMFGSDWPLVRLADDYSAWLGHYLDWTAALSPDERRAIDSATARDTYGASA